MAAHRYWRLYIYRLYYATAVGCAEIQLKNAPGGANLVGTGTAFASGFYVGYEPSKAFDGNLATSWIQDTSATLDGSGYGTYIGYDFGAGNAQAINEVVLFPESGNVNRTISIFSIQYSDDNVTWNDDYFGIHYGPNDTIGTGKIFTRPVIQSSNRYWGLLSTVQQTGQLASFSEFQQRIVVGGANVIGGGSGLSYEGTAGDSFDNSIYTSWGARLNAPGGFIAYDYGVGISKPIIEYNILARNDASYPDATTAGFAIYSQDGLSWNTIQTYSGLSYTGPAAPQPIGLGGPPISFPRVGGLFAIVITLENELPKVLTGFNLGGINHGKGLYIQS